MDSIRCAGRPRSYRRNPTWQRSCTCGIPARTRSGPRMDLRQVPPSPDRASRLPVPSQPRATLNSGACDAFRRRHGLRRVSPSICSRRAATQGVKLCNLDTSDELAALPPAQSAVNFRRAAGDAAPVRPPPTRRRFPTGSAAQSAGGRTAPAGRRRRRPLGTSARAGSPRRSSRRRTSATAGGR